MSVLPHMIYRFNENPIRILQVIFTDIYKLILKVYTKKNSKHNIEGEEQRWRKDTTWLQDFYEAAVVKVMFFWKD